MSTALAYSQPETPRTARRPKQGGPSVDRLLRDAAFVLEMTQRVKESILTGRPLPGEKELVG